MRAQYLVRMLSTALIAVSLGCQTSEIETEYGRRRGAGARSVNGTSVLAEMFRAAGYGVTTWQRLSPRLRRSNVILWWPNSFEPPARAEIDFLEKWLSAEPNRTLVYVARDYDAAIDYWRAVSTRAGGEQFIRARRRLARSRADHALARSFTGKEVKCDWFAMDPRHGFTRVIPDRGPWSRAIEPSATDIDVGGRMTFDDGDDYQRETLLGSEFTDLIVKLTKPRWPSSRIILVINGSCLLNLPLVNHEHRKLAGRLISACGPPGRVTFLETGPGEAPISDRDPGAYTGFEAFTVWPISSILLHLTVVGILYCAMVYPIFGKPREVVEDTPSDFGKHVRAVAELLARTNDRETALAHVRHYRQLTSASGPMEQHAGGGNPFQTSNETNPA